MPDTILRSFLSQRDRLEEEAIFLKKHFLKKGSHKQFT